MQLRERQVAERRERILRAAESLIRKSRGTEFTMRSLAAAAEVSPATPYNLFESKEGLLYSLLFRSLDAFEAKGLRFESTEPLDHVIEAAENAVQIFVSDPLFLRPLYRFLLGVADPRHRPRFISRAHAFWRTTLETAVERRLLVKGVSSDDLAYALLAHFMGVLDLWVHRDVDDRGFRAHATYGVILHLWPLARGKHIAEMRQRMLRIRRDLGVRAPAA
jgi:AcrR family transcriptional regulator